MISLLIGEKDDFPLLFLLPNDTETYDRAYATSCETVLSLSL